MKDTTLLILVVVTGIAAYFLLKKKAAEPQEGFGLQISPTGGFGISYMA